VVAVVGSYYVQVERLEWEAFALSVPVGLLASAILVVNNVRDVDTDRRAGKRTLAVRLGRLTARRLYAVMLLLAFLVPIVVWAAGGLSATILLALLALPLAPPLVRTVGTHTDGASLNGALAGTGRLLAVFSLLLSAGILLS
ncbi:MAG: 1,4-dihydroxy-2-naphthoate polyprenyltransferase, partial [Thermoleophilaceae bacterium]|nr:1,4-dihydroxy-2-naphthoate polyprenyltransferase [Thermoleophilaceae bacterium]